MKGRFVAIVLIALLAMATLAILSWSDRQLGAERERQRVARILYDSLTRELRRVDTVYRSDTVRLWRVKERFDTVTSTVTEWKHDTVRVVEFVRLADSTVRACTAALLTCEQRVGLERQRTSASEQAYTAHLRSHPGKLRVIVMDLGKILAGVGLGKLIP